MHQKASSKSDGILIAVITSKFMKEALGGFWHFNNY